MQCIHHKVLGNCHFDHTIMCQAAIRLAFLFEDVVVNILKENFGGKLFFDLFCCYFKLKKSGPGVF